MSEENYKIVTNNIFGRYIIANRFIKQGELILRESPILVGPQVDGGLICFGCCSNLGFSGYISCEKCKIAPICNPKCPGKFHTSNECNELKKSNLKTADFENNSQISYAVRCLLLKQYNPDVWENLMKLEPHIEKRKNTSIWRHNKITVENILQELNFLTETDVKDEIIQKLCGIIDVNSFEIRPPRNKYFVPGLISPDKHYLRGLYINAALMAHDCVANTHLAVDNDFILSVHASVDIPKNQIIFFNYSNVLKGNLDRKEHLLEGKYFECSCKRCMDPSELQTDVSTLLCHKCHKGLIRPNKSQNQNWNCNSCQAVLNNSIIKLTLDEGKRLLEEVDLSNVLDLELLLLKLSKTFHPNHYLILELKQNMIALYSRLVPNKKQLTRRIELCQPLLSVLSILEPGISRMVAITKYEMYSSKIDLAHKKFNSKEITLKDLFDDLVDDEKHLKEAIRYLLYEPNKSPEGQMVQKALIELKSLRDSIQSIRKDLIVDESELGKKGLKRIKVRKTNLEEEDEFVSKKEKINTNNNTAKSKNTNTKRDTKVEKYSKKKEKNEIDGNNLKKDIIDRKNDVKTKNVKSEENNLKSVKINIVETNSKDQKGSKNKRIDNNLKNNDSVEKKIEPQVKETKLKTKDDKKKEAKIENVDENLKKEGREKNDILEEENKVAKSKKENAYKNELALERTENVIKDNITESINSNTNLKKDILGKLEKPKSESTKKEENGNKNVKKDKNKQEEILKKSGKIVSNDSDLGNKSDNCVYTVTKNNNVKEDENKNEEINKKKQKGNVRGEISIEEKTLKIETPNITLEPKNINENLQKSKLKNEEIAPNKLQNSKKQVKNKLKNKTVSQNDNKQEKEKISVKTASAGAEEIKNTKIGAEEEKSLTKGNQDSVIRTPKKEEKQKVNIDSDIKNKSDSCLNSATKKNNIKEDENKNEEINKKNQKENIRSEIKIEQTTLKVETPNITHEPKNTNENLQKSKFKNEEIAPNKFQNEDLNKKQVKNKSKNKTVSQNDGKQEKEQISVETVSTGTEEIKNSKFGAGEEKSFTKENQDSVIRFPKNEEMQKINIDSDIKSKSDSCLNSATKNNNIKENENKNEEINKKKQKENIRSEIKIEQTTLKVETPNITHEPKNTNENLQKSKFKNEEIASNKLQNEDLSKKQVKNKLKNKSVSQNDNKQENEQISVITANAGTEEIKNTKLGAEEEKSFTKENQESVIRPLKKEEKQKINIDSDIKNKSDSCVNSATENNNIKEDDNKNEEINTKKQKENIRSETKIEQTTLKVETPNVTHEPKNTNESLQKSKFKNKEIAPNKFQNEDLSKKQVKNKSKNKTISPNDNKQEKEQISVITASAGIEEIKNTKIGAGEEKSFTKENQDSVIGTPKKEEKQKVNIDSDIKNKSDSCVNSATKNNNIKEDGNKNEEINKKKQKENIRSETKVEQTTLKVETPNITHEPKNTNENLQKSKFKNEEIAPNKLQNEDLSNKQVKNKLENKTVSENDSKQGKEQISVVTASTGTEDTKIGAEEEKSFTKENQESVIRPLKKEEKQKINIDSDIKNKSDSCVNSATENNNIKEDGNKNEEINKKKQKENIRSEIKIEQTTLKVETPNITHEPKNTNENLQKSKLKSKEIVPNKLQKEELSKKQIEKEIKSKTVSQNDNKQEKEKISVKTASANIAEIKNTKIGTNEENQNRNTRTLNEVGKKENSSSKKLQKTHIDSDTMNKFDLDKKTVKKDDNPNEKIKTNYASNSKDENKNTQKPNKEKNEEINLQSNLKNDTLEKHDQTTVKCNLNKEMVNKENSNILIKNADAPNDLNTESLKLISNLTIQSNLMGDVKPEENINLDLNNETLKKHDTSNAESVRAELNPKECNKCKCNKKKSKNKK